MATTAVEVLDLQTDGIHSTSIVARFTIFVNGQFLVRDCGLRRGARSMYITFPARKVDATEYQRFFEPTSTEMRLAIEHAALDAYQASVDAAVAALVAEGAN